MAKYFDRFPLIDYNGNVAKNILAKIEFTNETKRNIYTNFDFTLQEGNERPDILSYNYYDSSMYDWLIYLSNDIIDPYYDYFKNQEEFYSFIKSKYGSTADARNRVLFFRNSWHDDERVITPAEYEALPSNETSNHRKYWKPKLSNLGGIIGYERIKEDWVVSTNKIIELGLSVSPTSFESGDLINQPSTGAIATVDLIDTTNNLVTVKHVFGEFEISEDEGISSVTLIRQNIPDDEASYWYAVNAYEEEDEKNQMKKNITLIKRSYLPNIDRMFLENIKK